MKANELRIGNWVYSSSHKSNYKIIKLDFDSEINAEPIPLTEEWLLKFGFKHNYKELKGCDFFCLKMNENYELIVNLNTSKILISLRRFGNVLEFDYYYVYQLQNLYFALTNEELTYETK